MEIPSLVTDLAIMLLMAGLVSILFKKIKLPAILGYIVVGFLTSPYFPLFMTIDDHSAIETLSELGVIIILFHIGLEFNFHKLLSIGSTAIVTAVIKVGGVMVIGYTFGELIGLNKTNSLFLGAMLSISSTVVIQKCFEELKVTGEKYTSLVMGTLIMEDLLSVFLMVILSTISASRNIDGSDLMQQFGLMGAYLIVWFLIGIYLLPTLMNRIIGLMNREMLIALSLGVCFSMALIADWLGFSTELGAFLAGSLFAGTVHASKVEEASSGIKDMFSVIFFMAVGMKVDPAIVASRWTEILPIAIVAVAAKLVFATAGMILSGQKFSTAVKSGFSLAPIGEFSFIIASLGISLGVMDYYLYPVIVSASILTTLITPSLIRYSGTVSGFLLTHLPKKAVNKMETYSSDDQLDDSKNREWPVYLKQYVRSFLIYGVIMLVALIVGLRALNPALAARLPGIWPQIVTCIFIYLVIALFLRPMMNPHNTTFTHLWFERRANRPPLAVLTLIKLGAILMMAFWPLQSLFGARHYIPFIIAIVAIFIVSRTSVVATFYLQMETRFLRNLNERIIKSEEHTQGKVDWISDDLNIFSFYVSDDAEYRGQPLESLHWGRRFNAMVVKIQRRGHYILLPGGSAALQAGDKVYVVGEPRALGNLIKVMKIKPKSKFRTLNQFMNSDYADTEHALAFLAIRVTGQEPYANQSIMNAKLLAHEHCMILGIQKQGLKIIMPNPHMLIQGDDIIWVMGSNNHVGKLAAISS